METATRARSSVDVTNTVRANEENAGSSPADPVLVLQAMGRKIGFTNRTIWDEYQIGAPMWGYIYDRTVHDLADVEATVSLAGLAEPRIEPEIIFGLAIPYLLIVGEQDVIVADEGSVCGSPPKIARHRSATTNDTPTVSSTSGSSCPRTKRSSPNRHKKTRHVRVPCLLGRR